MEEGVIESQAEVASSKEHGSISKNPTASKSTPTEWPEELADEFEPVRSLGRGGFASVMLARRKQTGMDSELARVPTSTPHIYGDNQEYLAIKIVGASHLTKMEVAYAYREIYILQELSHPNVIRLVQSWRPPRSQTCAAAMALQYVPGPTLQSLLDHRGSLSVTFTRVVVAQIVDAVGYLHSRAVLHRDLKPDNVIVTGADKSQGEIWNDDHESINKVNSDEDWRCLLSKWHATLIDFGFARALTPKDFFRQIGSASVSHRKESNGSNDNAIAEEQNRLDRSRHITRAMSAVGHRAYAAPEVKGDIMQNPNTRRFGAGSIHKGIDVLETLTNNISKYGLQADAYSLGCILLHCLTGIRPDQDVDAVINNENAPIILLIRFLCCLDRNPSERSLKMYKRLSNAPSEVRELVRALMDSDPARRLTVRRLRMSAWISQVLVDRELIEHEQVDFLPIALERADEEVKLASS